MKKSGMGSHQSAKMKKDEWLTPPDLVRQLGEFDLDPCAPICRPWDTAKKHYTINDNGLILPWVGRVWCNPPYGNEAVKWLKRCSIHNNAIALIFARTETKMFFDYVWNKADAVLFIRGRLCFHHADGTKARSNSGAPSCLVAYGKHNVSALKKSGINGQVVNLKITVASK